MKIGFVLVSCLLAGALGVAWFNSQTYPHTFTERIAVTFVAIYSIIILARVFRVLHDALLPPPDPHANSEERLTHS